MKKIENNAPRPDTVPIYAYDDVVVRAAHRERCHWIAHIAMLLSILLIIMGFLLYLNQYEYVSNETVTVDGQSGVANYVGKDGNIYNGEDYSTQDTQPQEEERQVQGNT